MNGYKSQGTQPASARREQGRERLSRPRSTPPQAESFTSAIKLDHIEANLFDTVAKQVAERLADNQKSNKPTQLRRFYDEICMWSERVNANEEKFDAFLPFIRMLNAKAAYAQERQLVDQNFVKLMRDGLAQVKDAKTMKYFKLFMEAVMGFYKARRPKDS